MEALELVLGAPVPAAPDGAGEGLGLVEGGRSEDICLCELNN